jgi:uncharacterized protein
MLFTKHQILKKLFTATGSGLVIGFFASLIGVGGGEFRLPILIGLLKLPIFFATTTNLIIGLIVSSISFFSRHTLMTSAAWKIAIAMGIASIIGGYFGAHFSGKFKERYLGMALIFFLSVVGIKMLIAPFFPSPTHTLILSNTWQMLLLVSSGFLIGIISGVFGVAGGEFRIPILMLIFQLPIKIAGTASTLIALPTQIGGLIKHCKLKHINKEALFIAVSMGLTSCLGSLIGARLVFIVNENVLSFLLGVVLLTANYGIYKKIRK